MNRTRTNISRTLPYLARNHAHHRQPASAQDIVQGCQDVRVVVSSGGVQCGVMPRGAPGRGSNSHLSAGYSRQGKPAGSSPASFSVSISPISASWSTGTSSPSSYSAAAATVGRNRPRLSRRGPPLACPRRPRAFHWEFQGLPRGVRRQPTGMLQFRII